jgi:hypothetical protein
MRGRLTVAPRVAPLAAVLLAGAALLPLAGCGDGHEYPAGFEAQAARGEAAFRSSSSSSTGSGGASADPAQPDAPSAGSSGAAAGVMGAPRADAELPPEMPAEDAAQAAAVASASIIVELGLPAPPPVTVVDGEEPFQKLAKDRKFDEFRRMCGRYLQLKRELLPYGQRLADGSSTAEDRAKHAKIERAMEGEFPRINRYLWDDRWSELDRAAMGWILNGGFTKPQ